MEKIRFAAMTALTFLISLYTFAQDDPDPAGDPDEIPLDNSLILWLIVAAVTVYGLKKFYDARRMK